MSKRAEEQSLEAYPNESFVSDLVRAKAVEPGPYQGLYKGILSKLNKMFDEEYADRERKEEQ